MHHRLKIEEHYLAAKIRGNKMFEIRFNDRGYFVGDLVTYTRKDQNGHIFEHTYEITFVTNYEQKDDYCVFGEKRVSTKRVK